MPTGHLLWQLGPQRRPTRSHGRPRCWPRHCPDATGRPASHRSHRRSRTSDESRSRPCTWRPPAPCSRNGPRPTRRRCPRRRGRDRSPPATVARPRPEPRPARRRSPLGSRRDLVERPGDRRVGGDRPEEVVADAKVLDVEATLATTGEHEGHLDENLPSVVDREPAPSPQDALRERIAQPHPVGEGAEGVQSNVGHDTRATGFHHDATSAVTVHLGSALLCGNAAASTTTVFPNGRAFPRTRTGQLNRRREELGLAMRVGVPVGGARPRRTRPG